MADKTPMNLTTKLMHIQTELKAPKNLYNSFGKYKYRNAESILEALKPLEAKYKVAVVIEDEITEVSSRIYVKTTVKLFDAESDDHIATSAYAREAETKKGMDEAQVTGATSSYARKYALNALFLLDDTKDVDSEEYQSQSKPEPKKATAKAQPVSANVRQELVDYCTQHGIDIGEVASTYKLNNNSTDEEFKTVLKRLIVENVQKRQEV